MGRFDRNLLYSEDGRTFIETKEGRQAYVEAIEFLRIQKGRRPFKRSEPLEKAARDHINDVGPNGLVSTIGSDGSLPVDRIGRYANVDETWAESDIFGGLNAKEVIERLIVCDGQPTRGFRKSLFNDQLNLCGIATGKHATHDNIIQIEYVNALLKDGQGPSINI